VAVGALLLLAGRRLFWLFVGAIGFIAAAHFAAILLQPEDRAVTLIIGAIAGLVGALVAVFLQKIAIGFAGAVAGAFYGKLLLDMNGVTDPRFTWIAILLAALFGALLMVFVFKWTLIVFSSIVGAHLIVQSLPLAQQPGAAVFTVLLIVGLLVQAKQLRSKP
jgi:uncharacterized membrane protein YeaQ/YmgE (transglycosylase-associated protein family)